MDYVSSILEVLTGLMGLYCLMRAMRALARASRGDSRSEVVRDWARIGMWALGGSVALSFCAVMGGRSLSVVMASVMMALMMVLGGSVIVWLRLRRLQMRAQSRDAMDASDGTGLVVIRDLQLKNPRGGAGDGGSEQLYFTRADIERLIGVRGRVKMLNFAAGRRFVGGASTSAMYHFESEDGQNSFILHHDDVVTSVMM
ncbi:hypothetical protein [Paracidovorax wautersii]|uniref:Uncharacterized protein n=1 Tax=Paracidovorax wautersii TaxID=1177982 RepID=A0A1I2HS10_9BURK|nr:hypothetical protein [Paracidovorax wautersii]SFF32904.1 hypothetical protein SAMN04489711_1323 [Paracidovorax wautersii]